MIKKSPLWLLLGVLSWVVACQAAPPATTALPPTLTALPALTASPSPPAASPSPTALTAAAGKLKLLEFYAVT